MELNSLSHQKENLLCLQEINDRRKGWVMIGKLLCILLILAGIFTAPTGFGLLFIVIGWIGLKSSK